MRASSSAKASANGEFNAPLLDFEGSDGSERKKGTATWAQTLGNIIVSIVGTGVLGLPYAFRVAGWVSGSLGVATAGLATFYCMLLLAAPSEIQISREVDSSGYLQKHT